jgi:hypothetical protein
MSRYQLPKGQPLKGGSMMLSAGSIVSDEDGVFRVVSAHDGSHVGEALPEAWIAPPDAIPLNQQSFDEMLKRYDAHVIVTYDPAIQR